MLLLFDGDCKQNNHGLVCFFLVWFILHVFVHLRSEDDKREQLGSLLFFSVGFPFWYQGEQVVNISMVAPFHWLLGFHSTPEETPQCISRKKMKCSKKCLFGAKRISIVNSLFSSLSSRNTKSTKWDFDLISNVIIEKRRRLSSKWLFCGREHFQFFFSKKSDRKVTMLVGKMPAFLKKWHFSR